MFPYVVFTSRMKGIIKIVHIIPIESRREIDVAYLWAISNTKRNKKAHTDNGNTKITDFFGKISSSGFNRFCIAFDFYSLFIVYTTKHTKSFF